MARKRKQKKRNPATQKIIDREIQKERELLVDFLNWKLETLKDVKGIGEVIHEKVRLHFGGNYNE